MQKTIRVIDVIIVNDEKDNHNKIKEIEEIGEKKKIKWKGYDW